MNLNGPSIHQFIRRFAARELTNIFFFFFFFCYCCASRHISMEIMYRWFYASLPVGNLSLRNKYIMYRVVCIYCAFARDTILIQLHIDQAEYALTNLDDQFVVNHQVTTYVKHFADVIKRYIIVVIIRIVRSRIVRNFIGKQRCRRSGTIYRIKHTINDDRHFDNYKKRSAKQSNKSVPVKSSIISVCRTDGNERISFG